MPESPMTYGTADELPRISQKLALRCRQCDQEAVYDVGTIFYHEVGEEKTTKRRHAFTNYFRCSNCSSAGPWKVADYIKMTKLLLRANADKTFQRVVFGKPVLFDGTYVQTPAMGEEHLLQLIEKEPGNAFLCTRLGNLLRRCGQQSKAIEWYNRALGLDPGDVEARHHLFSFAVGADDFPVALIHASLLVQHLLEGRTTNRPDLTEDLACLVAQTLRASPEPFRELALNPVRRTSNRKEDVFIRTLLEQVGNEEEIVAGAANWLLTGQAPPSPTDNEASAADDSMPPHLHLLPSLQQLVQSAGLDPEKLTVALSADAQGHIRIKDRHLVYVTDGNKAIEWPVPSLRELFRGSQPSPPDMDHYPPEYTPHFFFIEKHFLTLCDVKGDRSDQEMEEIYSMFRRRPDGRSLGDVHDFIWQAAALLLGCYVLSEAEFVGVFTALEHSTRKWALRPISRFYAAYLRKAIAEGF